MNREPWRPIELNLADFLMMGLRAVDEAVDIVLPRLSSVEEADIFHTWISDNKMALALRIGETVEKRIHNTDGLAGAIITDTVRVQPQLVVFEAFDELYHASNRKIVLDIIKEK